MLRVAFYRGPGDCITWAIRALTLGPYSHCEIVFSDGECFGASGREPKGVRFARPDLSRGWDYIDIPCTAYQEQRFRNSVRRFIGSPFDWRGVFAFIFPVKPDPDRYYCSEVIVLVLQQFLRLLRGHSPHLSPNQLYRALRAELR